MATDDTGDPPSGGREVRPTTWDSTISPYRHHFVGSLLPWSPEYRAGVDAGGTVDYLCGDWDVVRQISDRRGGQEGWFRGRARFLPSADGRELQYTEDGELEFGSHHGPASRALIYAARPDGTADVRFADGREFYQLDLRSGSWQAEHPCRADQYVVTVTRLTADSFTETWRVAGPDKDYELRTSYQRAGRIAAGEPRIAAGEPG